MKTGGRVPVLQLKRIKRKRVEKSGGGGVGVGGTRSERAFEGKKRG